MDLLFFSALEQFDVINLIPIYVFGFDLSITNLVLTIVLVFLLFGFIIFFYTIYIVPHNIQFVFEIIFRFVLNLVNIQIGKKGYSYFSFYLFIFLFIFLLNLTSLMLLSFAVTSHIIITSCLSISLCFGIFMIGVITNGIK